MERADAVKRIKKALKAKTGKTWSVHGNTGTAWGWITVEAPKSRRVSHRPNPAHDTPWTTPDEPAVFEYIREPDEGENYYTSEADCLQIEGAFGFSRSVHHQGLSISPDARERYVEAVERKEEKADV